MKVISINNGHNASLGFFENGQCQLILHEEKFNNVKNYVGFPLLALDYLNTLINFEEIDFFVFVSNEQMMLGVPTQQTGIYENISTSKYRSFYNYIEYKTGYKKLFSGFRNYILKKKVSPKAWQEIIHWFKEKHNVDESKIRHFDHHTGHALTPVYFYNLVEDAKDILLMTMDGTGDYSFAKVFIYNGLTGEAKLIANSHFDASIGLFYSGLTTFLGMKANEHEYKVMGLAAYVSDEKYYRHIYEKLHKVVWLNSDTLEFDSTFNTNISHLYFKKHGVMERFDNLAAAMQKFTEDLVLQWITAAIKKTGIRKIACSGGVFMNVKMNQKIAALPEVSKVYFQPSCGDESLVIGGAAQIYLEHKIPLQSIETMYLGHRYTNEEVDKFLQDNHYAQKYQVTYIEEIENKIAELLANFHIVARFKGAGEWGARSLCNRGILGNASDLNTFYEVNDMIKMRDFWMPFAPTILADWAGKYIKNWEQIKEKTYDSTKYMIMTVDSTELAQQHLRAGIHQKDKTLRPQLVEHKDNADLYHLLKAYEKLTGMGGILNTSLNLHGYPLVGTLEQAMFTFENSGLKYIALENYLVIKA